VSERAAALADDFARANAEAVEFARTCPADGWARTVPGEQWTVGVVLHHIAVSHENGRRWLTGMARGDGVPDSAASIDQANAEHAVGAAAVTPTETVALLEANGARLEATLRALSDEDLDRTAPFGPAGGRTFSTADLAPVTAGHTREHLEHARTAAGAPG
jgi:uncharacterized protein (DUF2252 family)